jgi:iron complex outermembrane receptor protein
MIIELAGRVSVLKSDGYIDRAASDLKSYFLQGTYVGKRPLKRWLLRNRKTYQSWNGLEDLDLLKNDRTFNTWNVHRCIWK